MYCKHCGKQIADDSTFCQYCGGQQKESTNTVVEVRPVEIKPVKVDVKAKLSPDVNVSWLKKLTEKQKKLCGGYCIWIVINFLMFLSGKGRDGFYPRIYKGRDYTNDFYDHMRNFGWAYSPKEHWKMSWDISYYGINEFIVYTILLPLIGFFLYKAYISHKNKSCKDKL